MSLEFILQLAYSTCYNRLSSGLIDRDSDSFLSTPWTYEDGWKLLLHDTYYTTPSTTQNTLSSCLSKPQRVPDSIFTFGSKTLSWCFVETVPIVLNQSVWRRGPQTALARSLHLFS